MSGKGSLGEADRIARLFGLIAVRAGEAIMQVRATASDPQYKSDGSPVTAADLRADEVIRSCLARNLADLPVITEETCDGTVTTRHPRFILVDPLDGTKEYIRGAAEFTVNIALIENGSPVAGAVYAPALSQLYLGGSNAYKLHVEPGSYGPSFSDMHMIEVQAPSPAGLRAVTSRSHLDDATQGWISQRRIRELKPYGSSLKFCAVAEGAADVYPRLAPTMEWDTAAGHAVLLAAGGRVVGLDGEDVRYGKPAYRNGHFVAWGGRVGE